MTKAEFISLIVFATVMVAMLVFVEAKAYDDVGGGGQGSYSSSSNAAQSGAEANQAGR